MAALDIEAEPAESGRRTCRTTARKPRREAVVEVATRNGGRRSWSSDQKRRMAVAAMQPGVALTEAVRRLSPSFALYCTSRRQVTSGELGALPMPLPAFTQVAVTAPASTAPEPILPESPARTSSGLKAVLPCGTVLRIDEHAGAEALHRVLAAPRGR